MAFKDFDPTLGFKTLLIDWIPVNMTVLRVVGLNELLPLSYLMKDARALESADLPTEIAVCYSQRFIHYLTFDEAVALLGLVRQQMLPGAKLFLSVSGLLSSLVTPTKENRTSFQTIRASVRVYGEKT